MDDDNSNNPSPGNNNGQPPPSSYRIRRPSASIISSTTNSPMFQAPTNPNLQPPPSPLALAVAHHSRQRQNNQNNIIFNNNNNNFGSGDIDDDVVQPSSNSNSRGGRSSANSSATSSSYNANNNRPQSPLGSPDSTAYWAPSPSPVAHQNSHNSNSSYRAPLTPGGMCVVSSSTSDDIPQSPFSPDELSNHGLSNHQQGIVPGPGDNNNRNLLQGNNNINNDNQNPPPSASLQIVEHLPAVIPRGSALIASSSSSSLSSNNSTNNNRHYSHQQSGNQDLSQNAAPSTSSASSSSSSILQSFNISPLRNKIKKASSFERFSLQAAIISNAASASSSSNSSNSNGTSEPSSISSLQTITTNSSSIIGTNSNSVNVAGPSRLVWDPSPPLPVVVTSAPIVVAPSEPAPSSSSTSSLRSSFGGHTEKFHIKIPSKKLAAKIASVYEQEQLNESMAATLAAAEAISAVGSASNKQRPPRIPSIISNGSSSSSSLLQNNEGIINSQSQPQQQIGPPSTLAQILNQSPSNVSASSIMTEESIMNPNEMNHERLLRELGDTPLNLTESTTTSQNHTQQQQQALLPPRNPVISSRSSLNSQASSSSSSSKKIPLTPKQKLLHRLQSGELLSLSPPPQQISQQQPIQQQQSLPIQTIQQQSISAPVVTQHQSLPMVQESMQQSITNNNNNNHVIIGNVSHSPPQQLDAYGYESLLRSRDDFNVQDGLGKIGSEDPNNVSNMLSAYDADAYSYYYQNILADEIFSGNNSSSSNRPLLMMSSGNLQDSVDQPQGHLEFVLGLNSSVDDHENDRGREDDLQLNGDENPGSQQQFLDPNDSLNAMKSQDSTLRNLLMMEPIIRNSHPDDSWLALAAAEYQNRINSDAISRVNNSRSNTLVGGGNSSGGGGSSSSSVSLVNISNNINNSWINEWPRTSSWQSHPSVSIGGVQDQDEVMDMSMIDHVKGSIAASQNKRIQLQMQQNNDHGGAIDDMDLGNGLPILSSMPVNMPIDLQQPISLLQHGSNSCKDTSLPMDLQQHHRMEIDDEPVNLMAVNIDQDQELIHHSSNQHVTSHHSQQSHQIHQQQQQLSDGGKGSLQQHGSSHHQQQPTSSYTLQIQSHSSSSQQELQQSMADMSSGNSNSSSDNIDERRIIRVKKNKDSLISPLDEGYQISNGQEQHENIIMDKPIQPKSIASLPSQLRLARVSGNDLAVFNNTDKNIASNCRLGPVEGPLKKANADDINNVNAPYPCLLLADVGNSLWQLDRTDDEYCNWMKFVRLAHSIKDQNSLVVESDGYLYFITCKEISPEAELQVGYSYEYAQKYGLPYLLPMEDLLEQQQENIPLKEKCNSNLRITNSPPPSSPSAIMQQQQRQDAEVKNVINVYPCFECEQEFSLLEELQAHLNTHKDPEEEIRKPKKKVLKKFQSPANNFANISTQESPRVMPNIIENLVTKEQQTGQNQLMSADSSMGAVESSSSSSTTVNMDSISSQSQDLGKAQDNSVSTAGGCQPSVPPKVKCTMCYKSFATKERLEKHMIVHSDEDTKPLKCNYCTKRFLTNSALAGHIKTHAEEGKFFECPMCDFSTPQLLQLKEHVQTHKNRETGLFYCPQCPKKFSAYSMIRKHIRAFHGPRQFGCDQCPMSFPTSDKLKLHRLKHSDHREFLCAECGRQFKRKDKLREHTKRIHETKKKSIELNIPKDKNSKKFIPKVAPEEYQKFPYKCPDCMVGFKRRGMLVNHLAKKHPDKKIKSIPELNLPILRLTRNYPCLYCERVYKSSSKRKAHILKAHPGKPMPPQLRGSSAAEIRPPSSHIGTIVQTVTDDGDPRNGIMNVSCTSNISSTNGSNAAGISISSGNNLVSTTSTSTSLVLRKEAVVGKVVATPHACPWCYRQYATRAKLLQHQRKAHINLMPAEMQTPRTQKNNVAKMQSEAAATTMMDISTIKTVGTPLTSVIQSAGNNDNSLIPDSSTSSSTTTTTTIQTMAADGLSVNEANVIGFLLTTTVSASGELGSLLPSEIVMVPVQNLGNASTGTGINVLHHQTSQSQPITINSANNPSPNIAIITSSNNNSNSNNNM